MGKMRLYVDFRKSDVKEELRGLVDGFFSNRPDDFQIKDNQIYKDGFPIGYYMRITSPSDMEVAMELELDISIKYLFFDTGEWRIIPLENVIAQYQSRGIEVLASASTMDDFQLLREVLEVGVDGIVLSPELLEANLDFFRAKEYESEIELCELEVESIEYTGSGDRVCVDTASLLKEGEGLLLGATSSVFVLVEAEVKESGYVNARPFRINAGPVSAYVLNGDKTNYLSELQAGKSIMVVSSDGTIRNELIGRVKIEKRPFVLLKIKYEEGSYPVLLQNAETVRLVTSHGSVSVTELNVGDKVLGTVVKSGRHFGISVEEFIEER